MTVIVENAGPGQLGQRVVGSKPIPVRGMGSRVIGNVIPDAVFVASGTGNIGRATSKTLKDTSTDAFETQLNVSAIDEPIRVILGRCRVGAHIPRVLSSGSNLVVVCLWGRGECDAVESITMGGAALPSGSSVTHYTGTQVQTVNATLVSAFSGIGVTWTNPLLGFCYSVVTLPPRNSGGVQIDLADFHAIVRGLKCYDPRDGGQVYATPSTWLYTNCPALLTARVLTDATLGLGMTPTSAFWSDVTTVANANDTALSGGEKKRVLNLCMESQQPAESWVKTLAQYAGAFVVPEGSIFRLIADGTASSVETITEANMVEGSFSWQKRDIRKRPNVVYVRFTEPQATGDWIPSIAPIGVDVPSVPSGEQLRGQIVEMPGVTSYSQANRESIERRNHLYLEDLEMSFTLFDEGLELQLGDVITVSYGALFTSKLMRIMGISTSDVGLWQINCSEYDPASYSTVVATSPTYTDTGLASQSTPPTVETLVLTETVVSVPTGAFPLSKIRGTWPSLATTYPFLAGYRVVVTNYEETVIVDSQDVPSNVYVSPPLNALSTYVVKVYARSSIAVSAAASEATITLVASGVGSLASVYSQVISGPTGWTLIDVDRFLLWDGDPYLRIRSSAVKQLVETVVYPGANQLTPGLETQTLDGGDSESFTVFFPYALSPVYDIGASRLAVFAILNVAKWINLYDDQLLCQIFVYDTYPGPTVTDFSAGWSFVATGRHVQFLLTSREIGTSGPLTTASSWQIEFDAASIAALMPTVVDAIPATSSASAGVVVQLPRKYVTITNVQITAESITQASPSYSNLTISEAVLEDNKLTLHCYDASNARVAVPCSIQVTGVEAL